MAHVDNANLVTASVASKELGVPVHALYRLAERGKIPYVDVTEAWHERRKYRFEIDAVRAALAEIRRAS